MNIEERIELKPCPFCGGLAKMKIDHSGMKSLVINVEHESSCVISDYDRILYGFIMFDYESEPGKYAVESMKRDFAKQWNTRAVE